MIYSDTIVWHMAKLFNTDRIKLRHLLTVAAIAYFVISGAISIACAPPPASDCQAECGSVCTNLTNDNDNCGACGNACPYDKVCILGNCREDCDGSDIDCGDGCVDRDTDEHNCGECGNECTEGLSCIDGECRLPNGSECAPIYRCFYGYDNESIQFECCVQGQTCDPEDGCIGTGQGGGGGGDFTFLRQLSHSLAQAEKADQQKVEHLLSKSLVRESRAETTDDFLRKLRRSPTGKKSCASRVKRAGVV